MLQKPKRRLNKILMSIFLVCLFIWFGKGGHSAFSKSTSQALIAIQFEPGNQAIRQINFTEPISGLAALQLSGWPIEVAHFGWGDAVCSINGIGCPVSNCFCDPNHFWSYEFWDGNSWQVYMVGADQSSITNGAIEGWRWTEWGVGSLPPANQMQAAQKALDWLATQQSATDGGYGSVSSSVESLLAIGSNKKSASTWQLSLSSPSLMGYTMVKASAYSHLGASNSGKLAVGLSAAGACLPFGTKVPGEYYDSSTGQYDTGAGPQSWAMLGVSALSETISLDATSYLKDLQQPDGGWEWEPGGFGSGTDTNSTALAIQALIAAGEPPTISAVTNGLQYLRDAQNNDGGFPYDPDSPWGTDSDSNSTAYAIQAIYAAGDDPADWTISNTNPIEFLLSLQLTDGSFEWQAGFGANLLSTQQAIPAMLGRFYPFDHRFLNTCPVNYFPLILK